MVDKLQESEDAKPGWRVVEEPVAVGRDIPSTDVVHPEGLDVDGVIGGEVESYSRVSDCGVDNAKNGCCLPML